MSHSFFIRLPPSQLRTALSPLQIKHRNWTRESRNLFRTPCPMGVADASLRQRFANVVGNPLEFSSHRRLPIFAHDRNSAVASLARSDVDRNLPEQWDMQPLCFPFAAACAENIITLVVRWRDEITHVLDQAEHRNVHLFKHRCGLARCEKLSL